MSVLSRPKIVVGVDGSAGSRRALRWAAEEAQRKDATLRVVLASESAYLTTYSSETANADREEQERAAESLLTETLRSVFGADTPDHVVAEAIQGVAERVLVEESFAADLLVLGSTLACERGSPTLSRVIRGCSRQACCPVMIVGSCKAASFGWEFKPV